MIPVKLTIEGLYSYQTRQTINFETLMASGLFGIFGTVGSGKSTIIEAITYALYGDTERLNSRGRNYNMMNLRSSKMFVDFEFINFENRHLAVTRETNRNSRKFEEVKAPKFAFYEIKDEQRIPLPADDNGEKLIDLSYTNFKRTMIIPQGLFREFLELGDKDRTEMMKEIFGLHRFDLFYKTKELYLTNNSKLAELKGGLEAIPFVSEEMLEEQDKKVIEENTQLQNLRKEYATMQEQSKQMQQLHSDYIKLQDVQIKTTQLSIQKTWNDQRKEQLSRFEMLTQKFAIHLNQYESLSKEINTYEETEKKLASQLNEIRLKTEQTKIELDKAMPLYDAITDKRLVALDLEHLKKIKQTQQNALIKKQRIVDGQALIDVEKAKFIEQEVLFQNKKESLKHLKTQHLDRKILQELSQWYQQQAWHLEQKKTLQLKAKELNLKLSETLQLVKVKSIDEQFEKNIDERIQSIEAASEQLRIKESALEVSHKISEYSQSLEDGLPCPLCGSLEHPQPALSHNVQEELAQTKQNIKNNQKLLKQLQQDKIAGISEWAQLKNLQEQLEKLNQELEIQEAKRIAHDLLFIWNDFDKNDTTKFKQTQQQLELTDKLITTTEKEIEAYTETIDDLRNRINQYETGIQKINNELSGCLSSIDAYTSSLKKIQLQDYASVSIESIDQEIATLTAYCVSAEANFKRLDDEYKHIIPQLATAQTQHENIIALIAVKMPQLDDVTDTLNKGLADVEIDSINTLSTILRQNLDIVSERKALNDYYEQLNNLEHLKEEISQRLNNVNFNLEKYQEVLSQEKQLQEKNEIQIANIAQLQLQLQSIKTYLDRKKKLESEQAQLQQREDNLKTMMNLFSGSGFVEFVSTIYLRQLCEHANVRFHKMTRNQLSLQLNSDNDFEVIDFLNDGKSRNAKTLSGGQAFQASLSLALALTESVQSNAVADRNFFFIDEGFGTQDAASIQIVFETLQELQKDNRIVGFISHIESLKEIIPSFISVTKDAELGSLVTIG